MQLFDLQVANIGNKNNMEIKIEKKVNTPESLLTIGKNSTVIVKAAKFAQLTTVRSAVTRLNQKAGFEEFEVSTPDNGATIVIKRN